MDISNILLAVEIPCNIGQLTNKKVNVLEENFIKEFQNAFMGHTGELIIEKEDRSTTIVLSSNVLKVNIGNYKNEKNDDIIRYLVSLSNIFMLDDFFSNITFRIISQISVNFNTMDKTKEIGKDLGDGKLKNADGIGYRYLFRKENNIFDEFNVEPYLSDNSKFYFEGIFNDENVNISNIGELINEKIGGFKELVRDSIDRINS